MRPDYSGQTDIFDPAAFSWPVHVIGTGGIGSALLLPLVKLGLRSTLHIWDPDVVEPHNVPAQLIYRVADVGQPKVQAAAAFLRDFLEESCELVLHEEEVSADTPLDGVVIAGVDSMQSRYAIWEAIKYNPGVPLYIDGRIGGEQMQLFTLNPCDVEAMEYYEHNWLFPDEDGSPLPCAARTVIHPPVVLAGHIIAQLTRFARDLPTKRYVDIHVRETQFLMS